MAIRMIALVPNPAAAPQVRSFADPVKKDFANENEVERNSVSVAPVVAIARARGVIMKASATGAELEIDTLAIATTRVAINRKAKATFETQSDLFSTVETAAILPIRAETQMFAKRTRAGGMIKT